MKKIQIMLAMLLLITTVGAEARPNIVFVLLDDLAQSDVACYGGKRFDTPAMDRMAREGMKFTHGYAPAPICSATRAAVLTGRSPARLHFEFVTKKAGSEKPKGVKLQQPEWTQDLPLAEVTIAEVLQKSGYTTGFFGKWHVNDHYERYLGWSPTHGPANQGFEFSDEDRGSHPYAYWHNKKDRDFGKFSKGEFPRDTVTQNAIAFLKEQGAKEKPFFLYTSHYYVHNPVHTKVEWLFDKYRARFGPDASKDSIYYAAMVETMDYYVGQLMDAVRELDEETLVVLMSDNGSDPLYFDSAPLRGSKWTLYEGGVRGPFIAWGTGVKAAAINETPVIGTDILPTFAEIAGADVSNLVLDGKSLARIMRGQQDTAVKDRALYWHFPYYHEKRVGTRPISSLRKANMKLVYHYEEQRSELFNLASDMAETKDLARERKAETKALEAELMWMLNDVGARLPRVK